MPDRIRPNPVFWEHRNRVLIRPYSGRPADLLPALYVAGDLSHFEMPAIDAMGHAKDFACPDATGTMRTFRRLDAHWLSFLARRLDQVQHPVLSQRWASVNAWAVARWGQTPVDRALRMQPDARYRAPALPAAA